MDIIEHLYNPPLCVEVWEPNLEGLKHLGVQNPRRVACRGHEAKEAGCVSED